MAASSQSFLFEPPKGSIFDDIDSEKGEIIIKLFFSYCSVIRSGDR